MLSLSYYNHYLRSLLLLFEYILLTLLSIILKLVHFFTFFKFICLFIIYYYFKLSSFLLHSLNLFTFLTFFSLCSFASKSLFSRFIPIDLHFYFEVLNNCIKFPTMVQSYYINTTSLSAISGDAI